MVHSIELIPDADIEAQLWRDWRLLAEAGLPSQLSVRSESNRPHVTVTVASSFGAGVDAALSEVFDLLPLPCVVGAPLLFGTSRFTVANLVVPSPQLLAFHAAVNRCCRPHAPDGLLDHAEPGRWTPHLTLARRVEPAQLAQVAPLIARRTELAGQFTGLRHWNGNQRVEHWLVAP
ncbi:2'-5' RNA ligase family protein [Mycobacterium sp. MYCO198283]|uniref:2'-5' RNA ligase family protein n=1 Tax=Mycobacterium sp. MYCO198283 TaxID=2883505 RepID=UPI001E62ED7C|nr:2'-5' RNA ligase family protein [Mycobacterium sp. MYCO198283]MCG5433521.1 2'-5' RNA ligase family protein [Mycobacterium sp. MYCO198283]